jgi:hypothetical protein
VRCLTTLQKYMKSLLELQYLYILRPRSYSYEGHAMMIYMNVLGDGEE